MKSLDPALVELNGELDRLGYKVVPHGDVALGGVAIAAGLSALTLVVGFLGVIALAHDACRFVITEGALTRLLAARDQLQAPFAGRAIAIMSATC